MPIYEFTCSDCGEHFEKLMRMNADTPSCPSCASAQVRKLVSGSSFVLKGSGWYKDHYGLKSGGSAKGGGSEASSS